MTTNEDSRESMSATIGRRVDLLLRTGQLLVESAADTNRIVRNMKRVAAYLGIPEEKLHIDVSYTMLQVNVSDDQYSYTKFQKCEKHGINMSAISEVSKLSWRAIEEDYTLDRYEQELEQIRRKPRNYKPYLVAICAGFACGGFCKLFGCDWIAFLFASLCAFIGFRVRARCIDFGVNVYMSIGIAAFAILLGGVIQALAIETYTGWYECAHCHKRYVPGFSRVFIAPHIGTTRYMKCPSCGRRSWQKKVLAD